MAADRVKKTFYAVLIAAAALLGIGALVLLSQTAQNSEQFGRINNMLLLVNAAGVFGAHAGGAYLVCVFIPLVYAAFFFLRAFLARNGQD